MGFGLGLASIWLIFCSCLSIFYFHRQIFPFPSTNEVVSKAHQALVILFLLSTCPEFYGACGSQGYLRWVIYTFRALCRCTLTSLWRNSIRPRCAPELTRKLAMHPQTAIYLRSTCARTFAFTVMLLVHLLSNDIVRSNILSGMNTAIAPLKASIPKPSHRTATVTQNRHNL